MATETKIARVAFMDRGAYSAAAEYSKWDFVTTEDSTYLYIGETPATGKPVTNTAYWKCIADGKQATVAAELANTARTELTTAVNTKLGEADGKIEEMNTTLSTYDGRVTQVESDIDQLAGDVEGTIEKPIAHALSQLKEEVDSLRILIEEGRINRMQIETLDVISEIRINGSPLIYVRDSAPSFSPDQVPQFYIDTSAGRFYAAKGTGSANDWF
ncbi:MAG: hypothetical protein PHO69_10235 [Petrimonas sp.]|nr:hypothetical protein [Petrimonas sp.]